MALLDDTKLAMRISTKAYDGEILRLLNASVGDIGIVGVTVTTNTITSDTTIDDPLLVQAMITYARLHFGTPEDTDYLSKSYDEQKAQLISNRDYGLASYVEV
jgi:hypothetical protein